MWQVLMMKIVLTLIMAVSLLTCSASASRLIENEDYSAYHAQTKEEMRKLYDEEEAISMSHGS